MHKIERAVKFLKNDIWRIRPSELPKNKFYLIRQLQTLVLAVKGFSEDNCMLRASALTFYTLMSIVPIAAMAFGFAKGFGYQQQLEQQLAERFSGHEEILAKVLEFARNLLERTQGGWIAGIGILILLWTVVKLLSNIEFAFNEIWGIKKHRTIARKIGDYIIILFIATIFLIVAGSITVYVTSFLGQFIETAYSVVLDPIVFLILKLLPYFMVWFVFIFLYMTMPNTKVYLKAGITGGIIAGTIFQVVQWGYVALQIGMIRNNEIYGSFAALPLFLMWLEISWMIVLFGAEASYAFQNVKTYDYEPDSKNASIMLQRTVALYIVSVICRRFDNEETPLTTEELSIELEIPLRLTRQVLFDLENCGVLNRVESEKNDEEFTAFQPAVTTEKLTVQYIYEKLEGYGTKEIPMKKSKELDKIMKSIQCIRKSISKSSGNILLKDV